MTRLKDPAGLGTRCIGVTGPGVCDGNAKQLMAFTDWLKICPFVHLAMA